MHQDDDGYIYNETYGLIPNLIGQIFEGEGDWDKVLEIRERKAASNMDEIRCKNRRILINRLKVEMGDSMLRTLGSEVVQFGATDFYTCFFHPVTANSWFIAPYRPRLEYDTWMEEGRWLIWSPELNHFRANGFNLKPSAGTLEQNLQLAMYYAEIAFKARIRTR